MFEVLEKDRAYYNSLSRDEFQNKEMVTEKVISDFKKFAVSENLKLKIANYKPLLEQYLEAVMAEQLFGSDEFQQIINADDRIIKK